jgi:periplasmic protein TonB
MSRDERQTVLPDGRDNYETVVLDFLNKEMSSVQPKKTKDEHSETMDVLVADLLKQVMTESEQPKSNRPTVSKDINDMLSEFPPTQLEVGQEKEKVTYISKALPTAGTFSVEDKQTLTVKSEQIAPTIRPSTPDAAPIWASLAGLKSKTPMIAIAAVCLLVVIGGAAYFLSSSSDVPEISKSKPALDKPLDSNMALKSQAPALSSPTQSAPKASTKQPPIAQKAPLPTSDAKAQPVQPESVGRTSIPALPQNEKPELIQDNVLIAAATSRPALTTPLSMPALNNAPPEVPKIRVASQPGAVSNPQPVVSGTQVTAVPILQVSPKYPAFAVKMHASATIVLDLTIDEKGHVIEATPVSGPDLFHKEAVNAALKWRYRPATLGGVNVKSQARITMNFKLK